MTTAHAGARPASSSTDETIRQTVRALRSAHGVDALVLARTLGISRQSLYNRLNGAAPFLAAEIASIAQFFACTVQDIFDGVVRVGGPLGTPPGGPTTDVHTRRYGRAGRGRRGALSLVTPAAAHDQPVSRCYGSCGSAPRYGGGRLVAGASGTVNDADAA